MKNKNFLKKLTAGILGFIMTLGVGAAGYAASASELKAAGGNYVKVTADSDLTNGQYLVVYENGNVAFNSALATFDGTNNSIAVTISNGKIASSTATDAAAFTFTSSNGSFKGTNGKYFGNNSNSNALTTSNSALSNTVSISDGNATIKSSGGAYLRYNIASDQMRFRYYKSSSYSAQKAIQLYKYVADAPSRTLTSITIKTAPSKVNYFVGDKFEPTGLVITANYDSGDPEDIAYSGHESSFTFNPLLTTTLTTTNTSISITYGGKSTTQTISVVARPTLSSIQSITGSLTATVGGSWNTSNISVTGLMSDSSTPDITSDCNIIVNTSVPSSASTGNASVTATYKTDSTKTLTVANIPYTVTLEHGTTPEDPFTVDEARAKIDAGSSSGLVSDRTYYVKGYYVGIDPHSGSAYNPTYGNMSIDVSNAPNSSGNQMEFYRMSCPEDPQFSSSEVIIASTTGDKIKKFSTTYELDTCTYYYQPYAVTFDGNGADASWTNPQVAQTWCENYSLPNSNPTKDGYTFKGWYTSASGGTKIESSTKAPRVSVGTLYAQWDVKTYTVNYAPGNYSSGSNYSATKTHNVALTLRGSTYTRNGYKQTGWSSNADGSTNDFALSGSYTTNSGTTLYPYWSAKNVVVLEADDIELDLHQDASTGKAPSNPSVASGVTYSVVNSSVARYDSGKFYPVGVGKTAVNMTKAEDADNVYTAGSFDIEVVSAALEFTVTITQTNCTVSGASKIYEETEETYTITASSNYKLPTSINVTGANVKSYTPNANYSSATLVIHEASANVSFTVAATAVETFDIIYSGSNYSHTDITQIKEFTSKTITLTATGDYKLPNAVTVSGATQDSYNATTGVLEISNPTGAVTITCTPVALASYIITVQGSGDYADKFTYSGSTSILESRTAIVNITPSAVAEGDAGQYIIEASDISVIGADKGAYSSKVLSISNPTGNVTITVTPRYRVLTSLAVTTAPSKTVYTIGETFSFDGAVITGTNNDRTSAGNVTSDCTVELVDPEGMLKAGNPYVKITHNPTGVTLSTYQITVNAKQIETTKKWQEATFGEGKFLITSLYDSSTRYYMSTAASGSNAPVATSFTLVNNLPNITPDESLLFTVTKNADDTYNIASANGTLYGINDNKGLRVGSPTGTYSKKWNYNSTNNTLSNTLSTPRFVGIYNDSDWRSYNSSSAANYKGSATALKFYKIVEESSGAKSLAGITATFSHTPTYNIGESVVASDFNVKAWYDDGSTETNISGFSITNPVLSLESNNVVLSYTKDGKTKTCTVVVPAVQSIKTVDHIYIEQKEGSTSYKTTYIDDGVNPLAWDYTNLCAAVYWSDNSRSEVEVTNLTNFDVDPEVPSIGVTEFSITGSYLDVNVDTGHNTVSGISVVAKGITSFGTWSLSTADGGFKWVNYAGDKFDYNHLGTCKPTWNDGTSSSTTVSVYNLIMSGEASIGLFETYGTTVEPDVVIDSSNLASFTFTSEHNGYRMALISPYTRTAKDPSFVINSFDQDDLNAVTGGIGMAYKYTHNDVTGNVSSSNIEKTVSTLATENSWSISSGNNCNGCYKSFGLDSVITISTSGEDNCGSVWGSSPNNDWRLYQAKNGNVTITAASGYMIEKINLTFTNSNNGVLYDGDNQITSATDYAVNDSSVSLEVYNSTAATNGQIRITNFSVTYKKAEYSGVDFRFKLQYNGIQTFADNNEMFAKDYGLKVSYGDNVLYFSVLKQGIYQLDGTKVTDLIYLGSSDSGYFVLKLGDVINDRDRASTEFTVQPYVIGENDKEYLSSSITTYSVESIVQHYHDDPATAKAASVVALYNIFFGEEE